MVDVNSFSSLLTWQNLLIAAVVLILAGLWQWWASRKYNKPEVKAQEAAKVDYEKVGINDEERTEPNKEGNEDGEEETEEDDEKRIEAKVLQIVGDIECGSGDLESVIEQALENIDEDLEYDIIHGRFFYKKGKRIRYIDFKTGKVDKIVISDGTSRIIINDNLDEKDDLWVLNMNFDLLGYSFDIIVMTSSMLEKIQNS